MRFPGCVVALSLCLLPGSAAAQAPARGTVEVGGGAVFTGGFDLGEKTAQLTSNSGGFFDQFSTEGKIESAVGLQARVGVYLTPALAIEGGVKWTRPVYAVRITGDSEGAANTTAEETLSHYVFDGSAVWHLGGAKSRGVTPFVYGGAGYFRELHDGDVLVEEGIEVHAGAGIKIRFGRRLGVRAEAGLAIRDGGLDFEDKRRALPVAGGSIFWVF